MALLLDTNIISRLRRLDRAPPAFGEWARTIVLEQTYLCAITLMEMEDGIINAERTDPAFARVLRHWQKNILSEFQRRIIPVDAAIAIRFSHLQKVRTTGVTDGLIAATAAEHGLVLVTHNVRHFTGLGIEVVNPLPA